MKKKQTRARNLRAVTFEAATAFAGYEALEHPDGTYTIKGLPIFGEVAADSNGNKIAVTPEWLRAALDRSLSLQADGFAGPVHVGHHGKWDALGQAKDERERVGALALRDLRPLKVEGKVEQTLFADITEIPAEKFERIRKGELPHVSVEYIEEHRPAIDSLAVTGSACPFKRYPNMKIAKVTKAPKAATYTVVAPAPPPAAAKFFEVGDEKKSEAPAKDEEKKSAPPATENTGNQEAQNQGDPAAQKDDVGAAPPWAAAIVQGYGMMLQLMQGIATKLGATIAPAAPSGPAVMATHPTGAVLNTVKEGEVPAMDAKTYGDLMGRLAVVERDLKEREKAKATDLSVATFEAKVKGWPFDDSDRASLRKVIEAGGDIAATAFIDQVKKRPKEMANSASDFRATTTVAQDSPAVMTFVAQGPVRLEQARRFSAMHSELKSRGLTVSDETKFIENQFATAEAAARANASKGDK